MYVMIGANSLYPQKLALTSPTSGGGSVGIVRSRTKAAELLSRCKFCAYEDYLWYNDVCGFKCSGFLVSIRLKIGNILQYLVKISQRDSLLTISKGLGVHIGWG
jgi:hypothetical protein